MFHPVHRLHQRYTQIPRRRRIAGIALSLALIGSGLSSLAALNDTLVVTNNFAAATIDLQGNAQQSVSHTFDVAFTGTAYDERFALEVANEGTAELRYAAVATAVYTPSVSNGWQAFAFDIYAVADEAACSGTLSSPIASGALGATTFGNPATGQQAGDRILAAGASEWLCLRVRHASPTFSNGDTATQTITFSGESTGI